MEIAEMKLAIISTLIAASSIFAVAVSAQSTQPSTKPSQPAPIGANPANPSLPTIWLIGDSTVRVNTPAQQGWGDPFIKLFDANRVNVVNRAIGGRSSRTFHTEGRWNDILGKIKAGDLVLMQFGHNDGIAPDNEQRPRGTLRGTGVETQDIIHPHTKQPETVHTYGWYMRKYVTEAREKGATPVMVTLIPRCPDPKNPDAVKAPTTAPTTYQLWGIQVAEQEKIPVIDLNRLVMESYAGMTGAEIKAKYFCEADNTHTSPDGAQHNAKIVYDALMAIAKENGSVAKVVGE
jgi:rhamnogalacturonan acetylesterase